MKMRLMYKLQKHIKKSHIEMEVDEHVLDVMENNGFDRDQVREQVEKNRHNVMTTTYYLLLKKRLRMLKELEDGNENFKRVRLDMAIVIDAEMISSANDEQNQKIEEGEQGEEPEKDRRTEFEKESEMRQSLSPQEKNIEIGTPDKQAKKLASLEEVKSRNRKNKPVSVKQTTPVKSKEESENGENEEQGSMKRTISSKNIGMMTPESKFMDSSEKNENLLSSRKEDIFSTLENIKDTSKEEEITVSNLGDNTEDEIRKIDYNDNSRILKAFDKDHIEDEEEDEVSDMPNGDIERLSNLSKEKKDSINHVVHFDISKPDKRKSPRSKINFERRRISGLDSMKESSKNWRALKDKSFFRNKGGKNKNDRFIKTTTKKSGEKRTIKTIKSDKNFRHKLKNPMLSTRGKGKMMKKFRPKSPSIAIRAKKWAENYKNGSKTMKGSKVGRSHLDSIMGKKNSLMSHKDNHKRWRTKLDISRKANNSNRTVENPFKSKIGTYLSGTKPKGRRKNTESHLIKHKTRTRRSPVSGKKIKKFGNKSLKLDQAEIKSFFRGKGSELKTDRSKKKKIGKLEGGSDGVLSNPRKIKPKLKEPTLNLETKINKSPHSFSKKRRELMLLMKGKHSKPESRIAHKKKRGKFSVSMLNNNLSHIGMNVDPNSSNYMISNANSTYTSNFFLKDTSRDEGYNSSRIKKRKRKLRKRLKIHGRNRLKFSGIRSVKISPKSNGKLDFKAKKLTHDRIDELKQRGKHQSSQKNKEIYMSLLLNEDRDAYVKPPAKKSRIKNSSNPPNLIPKRNPVPTYEPKTEANGKNLGFQIDYARPFFDQDTSSSSNGLKNGPISLDFLMVVDSRLEGESHLMKKIIDDTQMPLPHLLKNINFNLVKPKTGASNVITCAMSNRKRLDFGDNRVADSYRNFEERLREVF